MHAYIQAFAGGPHARGRSCASASTFCRYGLDESGKEAAAGGDAQPGCQPSGSGSGGASRPRRLSKHERAALKKGLTLEEFRAQQQEEEARRRDAVSAAENAAADSAAAGATAAATAAPRPEPQRGTAAPAPAAKRGQKGKLKKRQGKYADQDAEDAAILAAALGAQGQAKSRGERRAERKAKKDAKKQAGIDVRPLLFTLPVSALAPGVLLKYRLYVSRPSAPRWLLPPRQTATWPSIAAGPALHVLDAAAHVMPCAAKLCCAPPCESVRVGREADACVTGLSVCTAVPLLPTQARAHV